jgi:2-hydroxychromene-2-carboxylate isomerase
MIMAINPLLPGVMKMAGFTKKQIQEAEEREYFQACEKLELQRSRQPVAMSSGFDVAAAVRRIEVERPAKADASGFVATVARAFRTAWASGETFSRDEVREASLRFFSTEAMMKLARSDPEKLADGVVANLFDMGAPSPSTKYAPPKPSAPDNAVAMSHGGQPFYGSRHMR